MDAALASTVWRVAGSAESGQLVRTIFAADHDADMTGAVLGIVPNWACAVGLSVISSGLAVGGFLMQKRAASAGSSHRRLGDVPLTPLWAAGFFVGVVLPVPFQIASYGLAPMSLTTPLTGISVALNTVAAPSLLGERLQVYPDIPASLLILLGTSLTTATGTHHEVDRDFADLMQLLMQAAFLLALAFLILIITGCMTYMSRYKQEIEASAQARPSNPNLWDVLMPAVVAAGFGCLVNISLKGLVGLLKEHAAVVQCFLCVLAVGLPAIAQLNYMNRGMRLYQQTIFFPIYSALLVLINTMYGMLFYHEYEALVEHGGRSALFVAGVIAVAAGVVFFTERRPAVMSSRDMAFAQEPFRNDHHGDAEMAERVL